MTNIAKVAKTLRRAGYRVEVFDTFIVVSLTAHKVYVVYVEQTLHRAGHTGYELVQLTDGVQVKF